MSIVFQSIGQLPLLLVSIPEVAVGFCTQGIRLDCQHTECSGPNIIFFKINSGLKCTVTLRNEQNQTLKLT